MTEWWKQLFGESEGKEQTGILSGRRGSDGGPPFHGPVYPAGREKPVETVVHMTPARGTCACPRTRKTRTGLIFFTERRSSDINEQAFLVTRLAHIDGRFRTSSSHTPEPSEADFGELVYSF
jgi:glucose-6-phosphate isomerase